jgi:hypothetical protein
MKLRVGKRSMERLCMEFNPVQITCSAAVKDIRIDKPTVKLRRYVAMM